MTSLIEHPAFKARPDRGQFAKGGQWEDAWAFAFDPAPSFEDVRHYLDGSTEVAFEAFFDDAFFGLRLRGTARDTARRAVECVAAATHATDGASFFTDLSRRLELDALGCAVSFAEVCAVNAWRSVGPFRIDRLADVSERFGTLWPSLCSSAVGKDVAHRKAVELAQDKPVPHWFALPVSASTAPFRLDPQALRAALNPPTR